MASPNGNSSRLQIYIAAAAVLFGVLGGGYKYVSDYAQMQQKVDSTAERVSSLQRQIGLLEGTVTEMRTQAAANVQALIEIETQFCEGDHIRNLMQANTLRVESLLWTKAFGSPYPTDNAYYPVIGKCSGGAR